MNWNIKTFGELTAEELYDILQARVNVFVVEQECPYPEVDGYDKKSWHLIGRENGEIKAYARLFPHGITYQEASIGRVLVHKNKRGTGLGKELMERAIAFIESTGEPVIRIQAQEYAERFYASFGFSRISDVYLEDDIPHIDMNLYINK
ncbi:GNAT family N-acetyltransferase [Alkalicoccus daliensis]|uniref:ElaA protein n=1 Tax=Alkalicoccus daliensis TaxID=745820 RepID=A0A1H0E047_9BACI|nr:GNAT family N-acetyltransferase [Alkalicoccus daliensis]SDN75745.1 ElaA protein [Alkalicoccus daliensis]